MKKYFSIFPFVLAVLLSSACAGAAFAVQLLEKIEVDSSDPRVDLVTFNLNGAYLPSTFALKGDLPRVIFDFSDVEPAKTVKNSIAVEGRFIKQIRTGIHRGDKPKTRVVLDLKSNGAVDFKQNFDAATNTLQISLFAAGSSPQTDGAPKPQAPAAEGSGADSPLPQKDAGPAVQADPETTASLDAEQRQEQQLFASIPRQKPEAGSAEGLQDESTLIQPLSEIGEKQNVPGGGKPPTLYSIEFDNTSDRGEMIIFKLNSFNPPVVFGIEEDIPRIVCFFKDTGAGEKLQERIESNGRYVKNIRVGKYRNPDNIRVVLDLIPNHNYDLQQVFFKEDNMFMIIINSAGEQASGQGN